MKRKSLVPAGACLTVLILAAFSPVLGDSPRSGASPAGRATIDGKTFPPGEPGRDDFPSVLRLFEKSWVECPPPGDPPALPRGLAAEHTLRLETSAGPVDLVVGRMLERGAAVRNRLVADGWECPGQGEATGPPWLLERKTGKETTVVCLDETEGTFLLFREAGR